MPPFITRINIEVCSLPESQYVAICVKYASGIDANGNDFSDDEKAFALEITTEALDERLRRARKKLGKTLAQTTGRRVHLNYRQVIVT